MPMQDGPFLVNVKTNQIQAIQPDGRLKAPISLSPDAILMNQGVAPDQQTIFGRYRPRSQPSSSQPSSTGTQFAGWSTQTGAITHTLQLPDGIEANFRQLHVGQTSTKQQFFVAVGNRPSFSYNPSQPPAAVRGIDIAALSQGRMPVQGDLVVVWQTQTAKPLYGLLRPQSIFSSRVSPDGRTLVLHEGDRLTIWDVPTGQFLRQLNDIAAYCQVFFTPDNQSLIAIHADPNNQTTNPSTIEIWRVSDLRNAN